MKYYTSRTIGETTYTEEHDTDNDIPAGLGCLLVFVPVGLVVIFVIIAQVIYEKTGVNIFDM